LICNIVWNFGTFGATIPLTIITDLVIGLRVYALYGRNKFIGALLSTYIIVQNAVTIWIYAVPSIHPVSLSGPASVNQIPVLHVCDESPSSRLSSLQSAADLFMQAIYDPITFGLIIFKTVEAVFKERGLGGVRALIVKNGLLYYALVESFSPPGLLGP